jgi:chromosome segregation ATPase
MRVFMAVFLFFVVCSAQLDEREEDMPDVIPTEEVGLSKVEDGVSSGGQCNGGEEKRIFEETLQNVAKVKDAVRAKKDDLREFKKEVQDIAAVFESGTSLISKPFDEFRENLRYVDNIAEAAQAIPWFTSGAKATRDVIEQIVKAFSKARKILKSIDGKLRKIGKKIRQNVEFVEKVVSMLRKVEEAIEKVEERARKLADEVRGLPAGCREKEGLARAVRKLGNKAVGPLLRLLKGVNIGRNNGVRSSLRAFEQKVRAVLRSGEKLVGPLARLNKSFNKLKQKLRKTKVYLPFPFSMQIEGGLKMRKTLGRLEVNDEKD